MLLGSWARLSSSGWAYSTRRRSLWLLAALVVAAAAAGLPVRPFPRPGAIVAAAAAFLAGSLGWWLYQLRPEESSFALGFEVHAEHWLAKAAMLRSMLDGTALEGWATNVCAGPIGASWLPWALALAALSWPWLRSRAHARVALFCAAFCLAAWLMMAAVESGGSVHHLALVYPFPQLGLAVALTAIPVRRIALAAVVLVCATGVRAAGGLLFQAVQCGGARYWSTAIYDLAEELERRRPERIAIAEWGVAAQLRLLSADRLPDSGDNGPGLFRPTAPFWFATTRLSRLPGYVLVEAVADRGGPVFEIYEPR